MLSQSVFDIFCLFYSDTLLGGECQDVGDSAAEWFSKYLGTECRLYYMAPSHNPRYFNNHSIFGQLGKPDEQVICTIEIVKILILLSVC